jgi:hypothetical protein|tara:strand:+ start:175 stop:327 length:153 start_codon:yes stop_codon:yes gene_type:complete
MKESWFSNWLDIDVIEKKKIKKEKKNEKSNDNDNIPSASSTSGCVSTNLL